VVSAMGDTTDDLLELAGRVSPHARAPAYRREMDMLLTAGERISMSLLSMALHDLDVESLSFTGSQSGIVTDTVHGEARIAEIRPTRVKEALDRGQVAIVAGFQGVSRLKEITTLGRGGSDTTAVALAADLGAVECLIYTDVDGFYSADPRKVPAARRWTCVGWDTALLAAHYGAQVLHPRCVELAWKHGLALRVLSTFSDSELEKQDPSAIGRSGTLITGVIGMQTGFEGSQVLSVALQRGLARIDASDSEDALIRCHAAGLKVHGWSTENGRLRILVESPKLAEAIALFPGARWETGLARIACVGVGLLQSPESQAIFLAGLRKAGLKLWASSATPVALEAVVTDSSALDAAVQGLHDAFIG